MSSNLSGPKVSLLVSSHNRLPLFRRTLYSIATRGPSVPFEVVIVDDGSTDDILGELKTFSSRFAWKFVRFEAAEFEQRTGLKKWLNNPSTTNNLAARLSSGDFLFQMGNEIIAWEGCFDRLLADSPKDGPFLTMSTTYDVPERYLALLDNYGQNFRPELAKECEQWPLQSHSYRSDVTNYISLAPRKLWEDLQGYDERYYGGISAEDSDFVRRARKLPGFTQVISEGVSYHQSHQGRTKYYNQSQKVCTNERWNEGAAINRAIFDSWDGTHHNRQKWPWGTYGIGEIVSNCADANTIRKELAQ